MGSVTLHAIIDASRALKGSKDFEVATEKMNHAANKTHDHGRKLGFGLDQLGSSFSSLRSTIQGVFILYSAALPLRRVISQITVFSTEILKLQSLTAAFGDAFEPARLEIRRLGETTEFTATQVAKSFVTMSRAGFSLKESLQSVGPILDLASGQMIPIEKSAKVVANSLRQFQLKTGEVNRVVDSLAITANSANTDLIGLSEGLKFVGAVGNAVGEDIEEVNAALGVLANAGLTGTLAGTALRSVYVKLLKDTKDIRTDLKKLPIKISFEDVSLQTNSLIESLKKLRAAGLSPAIAGSIFGLRGVIGVLSLTRNVELVELLIQKQKVLRGLNEAQANLIRSGLKGSFDRLISAAESLGISLGERGLGLAMQTVLEVGKEVLLIYTGNTEAMKKATPAALLLYRSLNFVGVVLTWIIALKVVAFFVGFTSSVLLAVGVVGKFTLSLISLLGIMGLLATGTTVFTGFTAAVTGLTIALTALGGVGVGLGIEKLIDTLSPGRLDETWGGLRMFGIIVSEGLGAISHDAAEAALDLEDLRMQFIRTGEAHTEIDRAAVAMAKLRMETETALHAQRRAAEETETALHAQRRAAKEAEPEAFIDAQIKFIKENTDRTRLRVPFVLDPNELLPSLTPTVLPQIQNESVSVLEQFWRQRARDFGSEQTQAQVQARATTTMPQSLLLTLFQREAQFRPPTRPPFRPPTTQPLISPKKEYDIVGSPAELLAEMRAGLVEGISGAIGPIGLSQKQIWQSFIGGHKAAAEEATNDIKQTMEAFVDSITSILPNAIRNKAKQLLRPIFGDIDFFGVGDIKERSADARKAIEDIMKNWDQEGTLQELMATVQEQVIALQEELQLKAARDPDLLKASMQQAADFQKEYNSRIEQAATKHNEEMLQLQNELKQGFMDIGTTAATAFTEVAFGARSLNDALRSVLEVIVRVLTQLAISGISQKGIGGFFVSLGSALGGLFGGAEGPEGTTDSVGTGGMIDSGTGGTLPGTASAASGGVLSNPTLLSSGGSLGIAGEAGPEAILPLTRLSDGRLGVAATITASDIGANQLILRILSDIRSGTIGSINILKEIKETFESQTEKLNTNLGDSVATFINTVGLGGDFRESLGALLRNIQGSLISGMVNSMTQGFFATFGGTGLRSAKGNIFMYAQGGIINRPITFPMKNRNVGVAGEAGPEAIVPLERDSQGRLGVSAVGLRPIVVNINTPNPDAFRKSQAQIIKTFQDLDRRR